MEEVGKITDHLIPKEQSQSSEILIINARLEIPVSSVSHTEGNAASKKVLDALSPLGLVTEINVQPAELTGSKKSTEQKQQPLSNDESVPASANEGLLRLIWKLPYLRWPLLILIALIGAGITIFATMPDEIKLKILKALGLA